MSIEVKVADHYSNPEMLDHISNDLQRKGVSLEDATIEDLSPYDELHIGGRIATEHFIKQLGLDPNMKVLDVGCGIGGAARYVAKTYGSSVTGIDLTSDFIFIASELTNYLKLEDKAKFVCLDATQMPVKVGSYDAAYTIHACMNIADKKTLYSKIYQNLKSGSIFGIYDVLADSAIIDMQYPAPWSDGDTSFLVSADDTLSLLKAAGFEIVSAVDRRDFALEALTALLERLTSDHVKARRASYPVRIENLLSNIQNNCCCPWEIIARKP